MAVVVKDNRIQIERLESGPWGTNAYIVICQQTKDSVLIDAPAEATTLKKEKAEFAVFAARHHDPNLCGDVLWLSS